MYVQRYLSHFPAAGEVVFFDRSWYNRAGVERVMGFCSEDEAFRFLRLAPLVERAMVDSGIILLKYWLEVGQDEQTRRIESRINDPRKVWKLSPMGLKSYSRWYDYSRARDEMFAATSTDFAPWHVADSNDKKRARLNIISHLLEQIPYESRRVSPSSFPSARSEAATASPTAPTSTSRRSTECQRRRLTRSCRVDARRDYGGDPWFVPLARADRGCECRRQDTRKLSGFDDDDSRSVRAVVDHEDALSCR
jgi:polyphosphate kinase